MKISKYPHFKSKQFLLGREKWSMVNRKICEGLWDFAFSVCLVLRWLLWLWFKKSSFIKSAFSCGWSGFYICLVKTVVEIEVE